MRPRQWHITSFQTLFGSLISATIMLIPMAAANAASPDAQKPPPPLTAQWWQTFLAINSSNSNPLDRCDLGTPNVLFLAGTAGGSTTRTCTVTANKSILVPLINVECSEDEDNGPTPNEWRTCAQGITDQFTNLSLTIDGVPVSDDLTRFRVQSQVFSFTSADPNIFGVPPVTNSRAVADGYWALIKPLVPGTHTLSFGGAYPPGHFTTIATYTLNVTPST
jgi:hypothetical protein